MRDYKKEYREYQGKPEQIKRRAKRNAARAKMMKLGHVRKGDGKDVHHRNNNPHHNGTKNLAATSRSKNRGYPRDANNKPKKGLSKLAARVDKLIEFTSRRGFLKMLGGAAAALTSGASSGIPQKVVSTISKKAPVSGLRGSQIGWKRALDMAKSRQSESVVAKTLAKYGGEGPISQRVLSGPKADVFRKEWHRTITPKDFADTVAKEMATKGSAYRDSVGTLKSVTRDIARNGKKSLPAEFGGGGSIAAPRDLRLKAEKMYPASRISARDVSPSMAKKFQSKKYQEQLLKRADRLKAARDKRTARDRELRLVNPSPFGSPNRPYIGLARRVRLIELASKPPILERLVKQLKRKGMPTGQAHAVAISQQQKAGNLKKGSIKATKKGVSRGKMTPRQRAIDRGRSPGSIPKAEL